MQTAIDIAPLGELADPGTIAELGAAAEAAGWDGLSIWDSLGVDMGTVAADPFVALAGVAAATTDLRLILCVAVLSRRRPQLVAQSAATLDRLSDGRLTLGVGVGGDPGDLSLFGDGAPIADLVARTDAAIAVIEPWLSLSPMRASVDALREIVAAGPPRA
ncbi:MAG: LLM class flavin-dependent oxidoreductase [Chloroflexi bacterium]|nr:LLM class flavin-dependent oxidoreductase [Chloroflexota bacterium]